MSFIGGLFSGSQGAGFQAERAASPEQAQQLYEQQQQKLAQQQAFTQALMAQSPQAIAAQQNLVTQLGQQAQGMGPSVAQRQLAETTGQNVANTAALMASKRGASANAGLVGRQAALAGMGAQQQAAGQAATLRAQEQLAAQQLLGGVTGQQLGQIQGAQQLGIQGVGQAQANVYDAIAQRNKTQGALAQTVTGQQGEILGGLLSGASMGLMGAAKGVPKGAEGGIVKKYPDGGMVSNDASSAIGTPSYWQKVQNEYKSLQDKEKEQQPALYGGFQKAGTAIGSAIGQGIKGMFAHGGEVPAMLSPGEKYLPPREVEEVAKGKKSVDKAGKMIPGRAKVDGDSLKNDTVHARLEEGGIVIPRSVMQSKNPSEQARKFVDAVLARQAMKRK